MIRRGDRIHKLVIEVGVGFAVGGAEAVVLLGGAAAGRLAAEGTDKPEDSTGVGHVAGVGIAIGP